MACYVPSIGSLSITDLDRLSVIIGKQETKQVTCCRYLYTHKLLESNKVYEMRSYMRCRGILVVSFVRFHFEM